MNFDAEYFSRIYQLFHDDGDIVEVRALNGPTGKNSAWKGWSRGTVIGFFNDPVAYGECVYRLNDIEFSGIYQTIQVVRSELHARAPNELIVPGKDIATKDIHVTHYQWILADVDRRETFGVSATDEELAQLHEVRNSVLQYLKSIGVERGVKVFSGNGYHLYIRIVRIENNEQTATKIKHILHGLSKRFSTDFAHIDTGVWNASRIAKIPSTYARKGGHTSDRPHRRSHLEHKTIRAIDVIPEYLLF